MVDEVVPIRKEIRSQRSKASAEWRSLDQKVPGPWGAHPSQLVINLWLLFEDLLEKGTENTLFEVSSRSLSGQTSSLCARHRQATR